MQMYKMIPGKITPITIPTVVYDVYGVWGALVPQVVNYNAVVYPFKIGSNVF